MMIDNETVRLFLLGLMNLSFAEKVAHNACERKTKNANSIDT